MYINLCESYAKTRKSAQVPRIPHKNLFKRVMGCDDGDGLSMPFPLCASRKALELAVAALHPPGNPDGVDARC